MRKLEWISTVVLIIIGTSLAAAENQPTKAWLGVQLAADNGGIRIAEVIHGSAASTAGLMIDDRIVRIADRPVTMPADVTTIVGRMSVGDELPLQIRRKDTVFEARVILTGEVSAAELLRLRLVGKVAPDFELPVVHGSGKSTLRLSDFQDEVVLLEFWATWCQNCGDVHRDLNAALARAASKKSKGFVVLSLAAERTSQIDDYLKEHRLNYPVLFDQFANVRAAFHAPSLPTLVVIDRDGIVRFAGAGADENVQAAITTAQRLSLAR